METELFKHIIEACKKEREKEKNKVRERNTKPSPTIHCGHGRRGAYSSLCRTSSQLKKTAPSCSRPLPLITFNADDEYDSMGLANPNGTRARSSLSL